MFLWKIPGGGHGNLLQDSCLEYPVDEGAWWAEVHRVAKSQAWLKWLNTHTCEKQVDFCNRLQNLSGLRARLFLTHSKSRIDVPGLLAFAVALFQMVLGYLGCSSLRFYLVAIHLAIMKGRWKKGKCLPKPINIFNHFAIEVTHTFSSHFIRQNKSRDFTYMERWGV